MIHLTPTELGREFGMHRREVISKCMEWGVPIFQGRIDKELFRAKKLEAEDPTEVIRAAIRRLRQANVAGVLRESDHRDAGRCEEAWSVLSRHADRPRRNDVA